MTESHGTTSGGNAGGGTARAPARGFDEYVARDAAGLAQLVRDREVTAEELAGMAAAAIEALNPQLNAVIEVWQDRVQHADADADLTGPLAGVPFFLKDTGSSEAGRKQECGSRLMEGQVTAVTNELTSKMKQAGLNIMGRTTCPDNAYTLDSSSELFGQTHNPWNLEFICGGSSSGSAAIVAAGIVPMAHGNDGGGSIRVPASMCGVVGLKPSRGRLSMAPIANEVIYSEVAEGVLSRSVRDTAAFFDAVAGSNMGRFILAAPPTRPYTAELNDPERFRIAVSLDAWGPCPAPPAHIAAEVTKTAALLESLGHDVVEATPTVDFDAFYEAFTAHWIGGALIFDLMAQEAGVTLSPDLLEHTLFQTVVAARDISLAQWMMKDYALMQTTQQLDGFFRDGGFDLVLTPTVAIDTPPLDNIYRLHREGVDVAEWMRLLWEACPYTPLCNATGVPAISLPLGREGNGLPLGMHFIGRWGDEGKLLNLAAQLERAEPWIENIPPVHVSNLCTQ